MRFTCSLLVALAAVLSLSGTALAQGLPPALEADRLLQIAASEMDKGPQADWPRVAAALKGAEATGEPMSTNFDYHYGRALHAAGQHADAAQRLERYLRTHGKKARYYSEAMAQYSGTQTALEQGRAAAAAQAHIEKGWQRYRSRWTAERRYDCSKALERVRELAPQARDVQCKCDISRWSERGRAKMETECQVRFVGNWMIDTKLPYSTTPRERYPSDGGDGDINERMITAAE